MQFFFVKKQIGCFVETWMHFIAGGNQVGYNFVEVLMQVFIIGGNQVGCLCWSFNAFVGFGNSINLFVETLIDFIIIRIELASLLEIYCIL